MRHSLSYGGVPAEPKFKYPRPAKPELMVVADISGSVAAFARFTLMLVYAIQNQFSKVRSFVFIDGIDEVTDYFRATEDITDAIHRVNTEADVVWVDGHSDYGHAFEVFWERYGKDVGPKTTVLLLGDARNNYHASQAWVVKEIRQKARHVYWLNPEPRSYWNTGDSIVGDYGTHTDGVYECRNLRQLEALRREARLTPLAMDSGATGCVDPRDRRWAGTVSGALVVGGFLGDRHVVRVALVAPGGGDPHEAGAVRKRVERGGAGVAHAAAQAADELVDDVAERAGVGRRDPRCPRARACGVGRADAPTTGRWRSGRRRGPASRPSSPCRGSSCSGGPRTARSRRGLVGAGQQRAEHHRRRRRRRSP